MAADGEADHRTSSAGAGTGGTITGVARYLKATAAERPDHRRRPGGSVYSGGSGRPYLVEGVGEDFFPGRRQPELYDDVIAISDEESFLHRQACQPD